jgi:hypothetical protein
MLRPAQMPSSTWQSRHRSQPEVDFVAGLEAGDFISSRANYDIAARFRIHLKCL